MTGSVGVRTAPMTIPIHHGTPKNTFASRPLTIYVPGMTTRRTAAIAFDRSNTYRSGSRIAAPNAASPSVNRDICSKITVGSPKLSTRSSPRPAGPMTTP